MRDFLLLKVHFGAIVKFGKLKDQKVENMRTVNQYLHQKRAKRLIAVLRTNLDQIKMKEQKLRQACQFHLFRRPEYQKRAALNSLRKYKDW